MIQANQEMSFGGWLRKRRRELDLTQQALADQARCTRITIRRIESGTLKPSKELVETLLDILGISKLERTAWVQFARGMRSQPIPNPSPSRTNLPAQLTSFIGREQTLENVKAALFKYRLVTLTGSGGVGKSRLSVQVAAELMNTFPDGVWFIELAPLSDPSLIPQTLQNTMGLLEQNNLTALQTLQEHLKEKKVLIVLDNCEHLIEACANLVFELLSHTTNLKILASSREALGVHGEFSWRVPSLTVPDVNNLPDAEKLSQYEAVKLFTERAQLTGSDFTVNTSNASAVAQICSRLDGIPLAIELAAARLKTLSMDQIQARLDDCFNLLTNGARTALPRHQTLRATIDWSYTLLSENEKTLFRRLAVFIGSWSLEAAEAICSGNGIKRENVIGLISSLTQKSLINTVKSAEGTRYEQLETIRIYTREKLSASDELHELRRQHLQYFVEFAKRAEPELRSSAQVKWLNTLELEISSLRAAMQWAKETDKEAFLELTSSLWLFFRTLKHKKEGIEWLSSAVEENKNTPSPFVSTAMARLTYLCIYMAISQHQAESYAEAALTMSRQLSDKPAEALTLISLAEIEFERMDGKAGPAHVEQALEIAQEIKDSWLISTALIQKGKFTQLKNPMEGMLIFENSLKEAHLSGDKRVISSGLFWIFINLLAAGQFSRARQVAQERITVASEIGDKDAIIYTHNALGGIGLYEEDYLFAEDHAETVILLAKSYYHDSGLLHGLGTAALTKLAGKNLSQALEISREMESLTLSRQVHLKADLGYHLFLRNWIYMLAGDMESMRSNARELTAIYRYDNNILLSIEYLRAFASLAFMGGDYTQHTMLTSVETKLHERVALAFFDFPFMNRLRAEQLAKSRDTLGETAFNKAWEDGQMMALEEAKEYSLELMKLTSSQE